MYMHLSVPLPRRRGQRGLFVAGRVFFNVVGTCDGAGAAAAAGEDAT